MLIQSIEMVNLAAVDLNLLVVFDALLAERSVTQAGVRLGLSQPAVSNALSRLRTTLKDPLLVRSGATMEPTPRALELVAPLRHALRTISQAIQEPTEFHPTQSTQAFRIAAADDVELTVLPKLLEQLRRDAPGVNVVMSRLLGNVEDGLRTGQVDLYLGVWFNVPQAFHKHLLRKERFSCIVRENHPVIKRRLTLKQFTEASHVLVAPAERPGSVVDTALADRGLSRRVALRTPHFLVAPLVVARTDLIATLPRRVASAFLEILPLKVFDPPLDTPGFPVQMVWHPRTHEHPPHVWLRQRIMDVATGAEDW